METTKIIVENAQPLENAQPIKKSKYTEAQKRAIKKYRDNNREKYNESNKIHTRNYYNKNKDSEEFKKRNCEKFKRYYEKKKLEKKNILENSFKENISIL